MSEASERMREHEFRIGAWMLEHVCKEQYKRELRREAERLGITALGNTPIERIIDTIAYQKFRDDDLDPKEDLRIDKAREAITKPAQGLPR